MTTEYPKIETLYERDNQTHRLKSGLILKNPTYGLLKTYRWSEKVDGMNIRAIWDGPNQNLTFNGRTDRASIPADLVAYLYANITKEKLHAVFPDEEVVLYGEGYGPGIQGKVGGGYSHTKKFILFDVLIHGHEKWWLTFDGVQSIGEKLGLDVVHDYGNMELEVATEVVRLGFLSHLALANGVEQAAEGMVGRPDETLYDKRGNRLIIKLKTIDF